MRDALDTVQSVLRPAVWAEVGYRAEDGRPDAVVLVPLTVGPAPGFALPYADRDLAEVIAASGSVAVAVSDPRLALRGWQPHALSGRVWLDPDTDGTRFREDLLDEELRKHPPSRLLADSLVQRREHWWFLPRLLLWLDPVDRVTEIAPRRSADDGVLFWDSGGELRAATAEVDDWSADPVTVRWLNGSAPDAAGPVCLVRHDFSPDLERRAVLRLRGRLDGSRLTVDERQGLAALSPPAGLWARWRQARAFERACRRGLAQDRSGD